MELVDGRSMGTQAWNEKHRIREYNALSVGVPRVGKSAVRWTHMATVMHGDLPMCKSRGGQVIRFA
jgi:hypothetical protein